jgi:hypothetical protein
MQMTVPYEVKNVTMTGSAINIKLEPNWNSVVLKMRETNVVFTIHPASGSNYFTVPVGQSFHMSCYNFSAGNSVDYVRVTAASGTLEVLGFIREG